MQQQSVSASDGLPGPRSACAAAHAAEARGLARASERSRRLKHAPRRMVRVLAAAVLWAGAGSALLTSTAAAGGVDVGSGLLSAAIYNSTPYTWTYITEQSPALCDNHGCWQTSVAGTLPPGGASLFQLQPNTSKSGYFSVFYGYDGYFTYRVDVVGGPPEYITVGISQAHSNGIYGNAEAALQVWNTVAPPPASWDAASLTQPGPLTANPQLAVQLNTPTLFDPTFSLTGGNFTIDATTPQGQPFVELLNSACGGAKNASCSFTQSTLTYGPGPLVLAAPQFNTCVGPGGGPGNPSNYASVEYDAAQSTSLSVGGGVSAGAEASILGAVTVGSTLSLDAAKQWQDTVTYTRTSTIYLPANTVGFIWASPTVGTITGTLVATIGSATFTATNFSQVQSGVPEPSDPLKQPRAAFSVVTKVRPMTPSEQSQNCGQQGTARSASKSAGRSAPPARLVPDRSVGHVALGDSQATVLRRLGWPEVRSFPRSPCKGLEGCSAVRGLHGTFEYKKRELSVVFGRDRRVAALIYRGRLTTKDGLGNGDPMVKLRARFPRIYCAKFAGRVDCSIPRGSGPRTVFRLTDRLRGSGTDWVTNEVLIYVKPAEVTA
jgi:hypothetical protein